MTDKEIPQSNEKSPEQEVQDLQKPLEELRNESKSYPIEFYEWLAEEDPTLFNALTDREKMSEAKVKLGEELFQHRIYEELTKFESHEAALYKIDPQRVLSAIRRLDFSDPEKTLEKTLIDHDQYHLVVQPHYQADRDIGVDGVLGSDDVLSNQSLSVRIFAQAPSRNRAWAASFAEMVNLLSKESGQTAEGFELSSNEFGNVTQQSLVISGKALDTLLWIHPKITTVKKS